MPPTNPRNQLNHQKSAYLLQHRDNPIYWWPYEAKAIAKAQSEDKPIFLSIGYSACHWCHVMAHESFEDQSIAQFLNEYFVCIKVDREEYPDLDSYYQKACQLFTRAGGWPLSAFLFPDLRPFFVGTYFPKKPRKGHTGFGELLEHLHGLYREQRSLLENNAQEIVEALEKDHSPLPQQLKELKHFPTFEGIWKAISPMADLKQGGFGQAPKFPHFAFYEFALEQNLEGVSSPQANQHIIQSLENMLMGGLADHVRGGIHRYSTDDSFLVPHFEKMLYDQAGYLRVLAKLSLIKPEPLVYDALAYTLEYLSTEMLSSQNYFFSSQDADSEGEEGLYFSYTQEEFEQIVSQIHSGQYAHRLPEIKSWFQISAQGNFEERLNVISLNPHHKEIIFKEENWEIIRHIRQALWENRKKRIPPATDNKGVASWNFQMIAALADVIQYSRLDSLKALAQTLFHKALESGHLHFIVRGEREATSSILKISHSTTLKDNVGYFEDLATFAEAQLRAYEISANPLFKENLKKSLHTILVDFFSQEGKLMARSHSSCLQLSHFPPNQEASLLDSSFKSPVATLIGVVRRSKLLFKELSPCAAFDLDQKLTKLYQNVKGRALQFPLHSGEALRANVYPDQAYYLIQVPALWINEKEFQNLMTFLTPRFVMDYHRDKEKYWQICTSQECLHTGKDLNSLWKVLNPKVKE